MLLFFEWAARILLRNGLKWEKSTCCKIRGVDYVHTKLLKNSAVSLLDNQNYK